MPYHFEFAALAVAGAIAVAGVASVSQAERRATPAAFIGDCGGRIMAGAKRDSFPAGCAWVEPIRLDDGAAPSESFKELTAAAIVRRALVESK